MRSDTQANSFFGMIDEISIYSRALSASEIQAIYNVGSAGKCDIPPTITSQPASQAVPAGANVTFAVVATGTSPLSYQWRFNQTNLLVTATNSSFTLINVQLGDAGNYSVTVSNTLDSAISSNATLTVYPPICVTSPAGLVSWWPGEGNALDSSGTNHGTLIGNVTNAAGRVGQAFSFDGNGDAVRVGNPVNLQLQDFTIEAWVKRSSTTLASLNAGGGIIFGYGFGGYNFAFSDDGHPVFGKVGVSQVTSTSQITDITFHHVAVTKTGTTVIFYVDGVAYPATSFSSSFAFTSNVAIGARGDNSANSFLGLIDDLAIYNRALSAAEVQSIYYAGSAGKCGLPPTILTQPQSRTVRAGTNVTFKVVATGTSPLSYQWRFNTTNVVGATNSSLALTNVQLVQSGNYTVVVTNSINSVTSAPANLKVTYVFVFGNGQALTNTQYTFIGSVSIQLQTAFTNGTIFYTLDGSQPSFMSDQYAGTFLITQSSVLRVITYSADFFQSYEADPITLTIIPTYTITATTAGGGTVSVIPTNGPYLSNSVVNVTATPSNGWTFLGWLGDASGTNTVIAITMNRNKSVQARFGTLLNITVAGNGAISLIPPGGFYPFGTVVQLYAMPQAGNYFALWGNAASGTNNPLSFTLTSASPTVSSLFASLSAQEFALTVIPNGFGQVTVNPQANRYNSGDSVTLTATPNTGQQFIDWSGDASGTNSPLIILMNQSKTIMANFTRQPSLSVLGGLNGLNEQGFRLTLTGEFGGYYRIDGSTNLLDWTPLVTITNTYGSTQFTDPSATNMPLHFYRAVNLP